MAFFHLGDTKKAEVFGGVADRRIVQRQTISTVC
jgi:hypothetical protein